MLNLDEFVNVPIVNAFSKYEEIKKIEQHEFKRLKDSFILMNRAGTNCAKKIHKIYPKKNEPLIHPASRFVRNHKFCKSIR